MTAAAHHQFSKGDRVRVRVSRNFGSGSKWVSGRIKNVYSRGAQIWLDEPRPGNRGHEVSVGFSQLEHAEEAQRHQAKVLALQPKTAALSASIAESMSKKTPPPPKSAPAPKPVDATPPEATVVDDPEPELELDEASLDAWLEMGKELLAPIEKAMQAKADEISSIQHEISELEDCLSGAQDELEDLKKKHKRVKAIVSATS